MHIMSCWVICHTKFPNADVRGSMVRIFLQSEVEFQLHVVFLIVNLLPVTVEQLPFHTEIAAMKHVSPFAAMI